MTERTYDWAEFRHFRYLLAILEKQGFRAAAEDLCTVQPNLSMHAKQFQDNASVRLYRKTKSGRIRITETGLVFIALAKHLLDTRKEVIETLVAVERGELKSLRLGCSSLVDPNLCRDLSSAHREILPSCQIRLSHGDAAHLAREVSQGLLDAAIVTLPLQQPDLKVEILRKDPLVCCLRRDHPLAQKGALAIADLQDNLSVLFDPVRHPAAHERLLEMFAEAGIRIEEYSRATHPSELQSLVKDGYGFALIREGSSLDSELTTRPINGIRWTVDMAVIYDRQRFPKTLPLAIKRLKRSQGISPIDPVSENNDRVSQVTSIKKRTSMTAPVIPKQLNLLNLDGQNRDRCA